MEHRTHTGLIRVMAWSGVVLVGSLALSFWLMGFLPPPSPALPAEAIKAIFVERALQIRIGTAIECLGFTCYLTWACAIAMVLRFMERGLPVLTLVSVANAGAGVVFFLIMPFTWATLAYRAPDLDAWFIQVMNDWTWFTFILSWPPFAVFMVMIGIAILRDHNVPRLMPRWVAMYNFWCALTISPAALIEFFKTGPFTYAGLIDFWFIFAVFFGWMVTMTFVTVRACSRIDSIEASRKDQGVSPAATL
ncbi:hypothetical protein [Sphingomonas sp. ID0503]|uniref:hypothetical protein n=1 Tax=Sphingomonas sp. ID0503 TaxID=3399691 RepID=UPI003AFA824F